MRKTGFTARLPLAATLTCAWFAWFACAPAALAAPAAPAAPTQTPPPAAAAADAGERLYVSNEDLGDVHVIDVASAAVVSKVAVGKRPRGIKLSADGKLLYVALSGSPRAPPGADESKLPPPDRTADGIGVVDLAAGKLARVYPSGQDPESFDLSPDGRRLYVSNEETAEMSVLDLRAGRIIRRVKVGHEPEGVTVRPDGKVVWVTCEQDNLVAAVDTRRLKVLSSIPTGPRPRAVAFTADGAVAFVTAELGALVNVVDARKHAPIAEIPVTAPGGNEPGRIPPRPMGLALAPDGKTLYVSNGRGESVAVVDVATRALTRTIEGVGTRPWGIAVSADGKRLYTANGPSGDVSIVDLDSGKVKKRITVGGLPWGLAVAHAK
jgi:YVTN family beta-propeller protein